VAKVTEQRDQLQALIEDIDDLLKQASPRFGRGAQEATKQRQILERARQHMLELQQWIAAPGGWGPLDPATGRVNVPEASTPDSTESAQTVLQALLQEMQYLRSQFIQPLRTEIETLQQERAELLEQVRQLEVERLRLQGQSPESSSQQEWIRAVAHHLETSLSERLDQTLAHWQAEISNRPLLEGTSPQPAEADLPLLDPHQRLAYIRRVQADADQALLQLDNTLRAIFETLQQNAISYQDSLAQGLAAMHSLGQQGEVTLRALISDLGQQLRQEVACLEAANADRQRQVLTAQHSPPPAPAESPHEPDTDDTPEAAPEEASDAVTLDLDWDLADDVELDDDEEITLLQLDQEIEQLQLEARADSDQMAAGDTDGSEISEQTAASASDLAVDPLTVLGQLDQAIPDPEPRVNVPDRSVDTTIAAAEFVSDAEADALFADLFDLTPPSPNQDHITPAETPAGPASFEDDSADRAGEAAAPIPESPGSFPDDSEAPSPLARENDFPTTDSPETAASDSSLTSSLQLDQALFEDGLLELPSQPPETDPLASEIDLFGEATSETLEQPRVEAADTIHSLEQLLPGNGLDHDAGSTPLAEPEALAAEPFVPASPDEDLLTSDTETAAPPSPLSLDPDILAQLDADLSRLEAPLASAEDDPALSAESPLDGDDDVPEPLTDEDDEEATASEPSSDTTWTSESAVVDSILDDWKTSMQSTADTLLGESGLVVEAPEEAPEADPSSPQASMPETAPSATAAPESDQSPELLDDQGPDPSAAQGSEALDQFPGPQPDETGSGTSSPAPDSRAELDPDTVSWETWTDTSTTFSPPAATGADIEAARLPEDWLAMESDAVAEDISPLPPPPDAPAAESVSGETEDDAQPAPPDPLEQLEGMAAAPPPLEDDRDSWEPEAAIAGAALRSPSPVTADISSDQLSNQPPEPGEATGLDQPEPAPETEESQLADVTDGEQAKIEESLVESPGTPAAALAAAIPARTSSDASAAPGATWGEWFLGLDIGTTGLSAVLLNRSDGQVYPLYWIDSTLADSVAEKIFRLPAVVSIGADAEDASMPWQVRSHGMAALAITWTDDATSPYRLLTAMKPLLQRGIPYQVSETQEWHPQLPWPEADPLPLQAVQLGLQSLLQTLIPAPDATLLLGATDLEQPSLHQAMTQLQGVIVNYPAAWSDTYSFNLREAILAAGLVWQPDVIYFVEDAIAAVLSGLPDPDRPASPQVQSLKQQSLYGGQWQGGTVVISAGASLSEIAVVNLPHDAEALSREDFILQRLDYGGNALDLDIICQLLHPREQRQPIETPAAPDTDDSGWGWQAALPELTHTPWSSLGLSELPLPRPGDPDLEVRSQLQQRLESSLLGQSVLEAARHLKLILQHQAQFNLVLGNQRWQVRRKALESQILLPYQRRLNQILNQLLSQAGLNDQTINQVICTGGTASLKLLSDWLRQKFPNATIIQDTYPSNRPPSCSRIAYGLVNLARYPQLLEKTRHQYSDYFLLLELLRTFPDQPMPLAGIFHLLEQRGINVQACQDHLFALLDGHLPPGLLPPPEWSNPQSGRLQALRSIPLFSRGSGQIYVPNSAQCQRLWDYLQQVLAHKRQLLQEPLVMPLWTMAPIS